MITKTMGLEKSDLCFRRGLGGGGYKFDECVLFDLDNVAMLVSHQYIL